ncbi:MAG: P1 family peptidase [Christensenellaceae bacterium]|jgi:L-aminopeptidase/D-esterase-like protein|nr:P1 family peptidase [Christensenellaceae bacterium]
MLNAFKIGHVTDDINGTGVTVIVAKKSGAVAGVCVRGAAPATRETDLLADGKMIRQINAVVLSGGSAFGLEAACGVVDWLYEQHIGYNAGRYLVPIVAGASLYDLEYKNFAFPNKKAGYDACASASIDNFECGSIGAGTGATISKLFGIITAVKSGIGIQLYSLNGLEIAVIVAVNALGDVVKDGNIILGAKSEMGEFIDCRNILSAGSLPLQQKNTTIGCVITNAVITKEEANILASLSHDGFALALSPAHTMFDGDAMFVMSSCEKNFEFNILTALIPSLTAQAIQSVANTSQPITHKVNNAIFSLFKKAFRRK